MKLSPQGNDKLSVSEDDFTEPRQIIPIITRNPPEYRWEDNRWVRTNDSESDGQMIWEFV